MVFNRFTVHVLIRILAIGLTSFLLIWSIQRQDLFFAVFTFVLLWILSVYSLFTYIKKVNHKVAFFIDALKSKETGSKFRDSGDKNTLFQDMNLSMNKVIDAISESSLARESEHHYFQQTVHHVGVGLISFLTDGTVEIFNKAAGRLLKKEELINIRQLDHIQEGFSQMLIDLSPLQPELLKLQIRGEPVTLLVKASIFRIRDREIKLISLQNIKNELEREEYDAWEKLIRVLTHEIMNSVTPVKSLTSTIIRMLEKDGIPKKMEEISEETISNSLMGLHAIERRNKGLINFVESYRSLTKIPDPVKQDVNVSQLMDNIRILIHSELISKNIDFRTEIDPPNLHILADERLITQVLINLFRNSVQALEKTENGRISFRAFTDNQQKAVLQISDNGRGIPPDVIDKIFIPFFTTKKDGSGIGLSLSRQIIRRHDGIIEARSEEGKGTIFTIKIPAGHLQS